MKNVYKIFSGAVSVCLLLVLADWTVGSWSEKMYYKSKYGIFRRQIYCLQESKDDILILGSSRAAHHYVPQIFEDSLGLSCYNAGSDGMCIYYHYSILASRINRRCPPKLVIYEVLGSDAVISHGATFSLDAALDRLAPHYGEVPEIDSLFVLKGWKEKAKLMSKAFRYNSKLVQTIKCNYIPWPEDRGYEALSGKMEVKNGDAADVLESNVKSEVESQKLEYIQKLINVCRGNDIQLIICYSPYYQHAKDYGIKLIEQLAKENSISFLDFGLDEQFQVPDLFQDASHMNDTGANAFTKVFVSEVNSILHERGN